jgi:hypothetical protein
MHIEQDASRCVGNAKTDMIRTVERAPGTANIQPKRRAKDEGIE